MHVNGLNRTVVRIATLAVATVLGFGASAEPINYQMVTVRDPGNAADTTGYGAVAYEYRIGKYEVTIAQYTAFLNAVAATDTYGLYNPMMGTDLNYAGISRAGTSGSYTYGVMTNGGYSGNRPITFVTWFSAARFANWMHNGQPSGPEGPSTTETGAYTLGVGGGLAPAPNADAKFYIPTEDQWYKAAYYKGGGPHAGYWTYATQSNSEPANVIGSGPNRANFNNGVLSVTQSPNYSPSQNYLTDVGSFSGSPSAYGTFDQSGNEREWNDLTGAASALRGFRGGFYINGAWEMASSCRYTYDPLAGGIAFRLAGPSSTLVPEIDPAGMGAVLALVTGALGLLERRRLKAA